MGRNRFLWPSGTDFRACDGLWPQPARGVHEGRAPAGPFLSPGAYSGTAAAQEPAKNVCLEQAVHFSDFQRPWSVQVFTLARDGRSKQTAGMKPYVFVHGAELDRDGYPEACPFNTRRAGRALSTARGMGLLDRSDRAVVEPESAGRETLEWLHKPDYLDALQAAGRGRIAPDTALRYGLGTADCPIFHDMFAYLALATGATLTGARCLLEGARVAFNPSGGLHHAQPGNAAGFCYLNDVALACELLARAGRRVLFLDIDVHHGDGVQDAFYHRRDVMTVSLHESGRTLFPGTGDVNEIGVGDGRGYSLNVPLPVGTYDGIYLHAFREAVLPVIRAFNPDVMVLEIGMDTLAGDPLAHLHLTNNTPAKVVEEVMALGKPVLATGGGGYHIDNTVRGWALCWGVMCGDMAEQEAMMMGMGGVLLENTDWLGGLRDRVLLSDAGRREDVNGEVNAVIDAVQRTVFPLHGL